MSDEKINHLIMGIEVEYYFDNLLRMDGRKSQRQFAFKNPVDRANVIRGFLDSGKMCGQQKIHDKLCDEMNIKLTAPYISHAMLDTFLELALINEPTSAWKHSGLNKRATREAFKEEINKYDLIINKAANYQVESGIREHLAEQLLGSEWDLRQSKSTSAVYNSINKGLITNPLP